MTLVEFLTARLDEDEAAATRHLDDASGAGWGDYPARVLREVAAKRAIVKLAAEADAKCPEDDWPEDGDMSWAPLSDVGRYNLRALATVYADHPDFREEWRS